MGQGLHSELRAVLHHRSDGLGGRSARRTPSGCHPCSRLLRQGEWGRVDERLLLSRCSLVVDSWRLKRAVIG